VIRVYVVVEGQTEGSFVSDVLAEIFWPHQVYLNPILLAGHTSYARVSRDVLKLLKQDPTAYCSTMLDFYGLGEGFPGTPLPPNLPNIDKVRRIEDAFKENICNLIPDFRPDIRFLPYLQLHEYEGLLFSDSRAFATSIRQPHLAELFQGIRDGFPTPEDINDDANNAPSKRVLQAYPAYSKVIDGTLAARAVGIPAMRRECPHFRGWLERLETLKLFG
jgi:uncharacterized protein DUF4276